MKKNSKMILFGLSGVIILGLFFCIFFVRTYSMQNATPTFFLNDYPFSIRIILKSYYTPRGREILDGKGDSEVLNPGDSAFRSIDRPTCIVLYQDDIKIGSRFFIPPLHFFNIATSTISLAHTSMRDCEEELKRDQF